MAHKNPWIALVLNLVIWGVGYIYNGRRVGFGVLLLIADVLWGALLSSALTGQVFPGLSFSGSLAVFALLTIGFAYDGYKEAKTLGAVELRVVK